MILDEMEKERYCVNLFKRSLTKKSSNQTNVITAIKPLILEQSMGH